MSQKGGPSGGSFTWSSITSWIRPSSPLATPEPHHETGRDREAEQQDHRGERSLGSQSVSPTARITAENWDGW